LETVYGYYHLEATMVQSSLNSRNFWQTHNVQRNYVTDKEAMIESGEVFTITHVKTGMGQFGERWEVSILRAGNDGEQTLTFARNENRDPMMEDLRAELANGYIDASLESFPTKNGQTAYSLCPPKTGDSDDA